MLFPPQHLLWFPRGCELRAPDTQICCENPADLLDLLVWQGKEISCNKPLSPHLKASNADLQRGSWIPSSALSPPGPLAGGLCLHVPLQDSGLLPTWSCDSTDGDYQYPPDLGERGGGGHGHTKKLFLASL